MNPVQISNKQTANKRRRSKTSLSPDKAQVNEKTTSLIVKKSVIIILEQLRVIPLLQLITIQQSARFVLAMIAIRWSQYTISANVV